MKTPKHSLRTLLRAARYLACLAAAALVLVISACYCSRLYTRHQVSLLMTYQSKSKDEALRRICEVDTAHYDTHPPETHLIPANKITITAEQVSFSAESYEAMKNHPRLQRSNQWIVHGRQYGLSERHYAIRLSFDASGVVCQQELTWYTSK